MAALRELELPAAEEKTSPPCRRLLYLGCILDFERLELSLPADKRKKLLAGLRPIRKRVPVSTKELRSTLGRLGYCIVTFSALRPYLRPIYAQLTVALRGGRRAINPNREVSRAAGMFIEAVSANPTVPFAVFSAHPEDCSVVAAVVGVVAWSAVVAVALLSPLLPYPLHL